MYWIYLGIAYSFYIKLFENFKQIWIFSYVLNNISCIDYDKLSIIIYDYYIINKQ